MVEWDKLEIEIIYLRASQQSGFYEKVACPFEDGNERMPMAAVDGKVNINFDVVLVGWCHPRNWSTISAPSYIYENTRGDMSSGAAWVEIPAGFDDSSGPEHDGESIDDTDSLEVRSLT